MLWEPEGAAHAVGLLFELLGKPATAVTAETHRTDLNALGALRAIDLPRLRNGRTVRVAGLVICRQRGVFQLVDQVKQQQIEIVG